MLARFLVAGTSAAMLTALRRTSFRYGINCFPLHIQLRAHAGNKTRPCSRGRNALPNTGRSAEVSTPPLKFVAIPPSLVNMRAELQVESFLKKQRQEQHPEWQEELPRIRLLNVFRSTMKRAVLSFDVRGQRVRAIGQSKRGKVARALCSMHAVRLIDHFSLDGAGCHNIPSPLEEEEAVMLPSEHVAVAPRQRGATGSVVSPASRRPPQWVSGTRWEDYVDDCAKYIQRRQQEERAEAYAQLRVPPTGNPLVDRAADAAKREKHVNQQAMQKLNNEIQNATKDIHTTRVSRHVFVSTLLLDDVSQLSATGVATSAKEAKQRCAMHALHILQLIKEQRSSSSPFVAALRSGSSTNGISSSLSPRYSKMLDFFILLCGVKPKMTFTRNGGSYTCELILDDLTCTGRGINRFEAERNAFENALSEMELYDQRLQAINSVISRYPKMQPQCVPTAEMPESLRNDIHALAQQVQKEIRLVEHDGAMANSGTSSSKTEDDINDEDDVVDAEARATIEALGQRTHDEAYANRMRDRLCSLRADPRYLDLYHARRSSLSICAVSQNVLTELQKTRVVVVCGTTGCGKTTQVPQYILDAEIMAGRGDQCCIVVTQPRRLSAFSVAERIANERLETVGGDVGYAVRLDARPGRHITLCTTGVLLQMLVGTPSLDAVSHLIIDEVHERDINCDVLLALVKDLLESGKNPRLKVVLMSATMQSDMFASYFGKVPVISVEGAAYPVEVRYLEDVAALLQKQGETASPYYSSMFDSLTPIKETGSGVTRFGKHNFLSRKRLLASPLKTDYALIAQLVRWCVSNDLNDDTYGKSILVFLPGWKELVAAKQAIEYLQDGQRYHVILLHSSVDAAKQRECFARAPPGKVKVVLATNIAESGITIDDAAVVIDTGLIKQASWVSGASGSHQQDVRTDSHALSASTSSTYATQLSLQYASRANCTQRRGRAGRTQGGFATGSLRAVCGTCFRHSSRRRFIECPSHRCY